MKTDNSTGTDNSTEQPPCCDIYLATQLSHIWSHYGHIVRQLYQVWHQHLINLETTIWMSHTHLESFETAIVSAAIVSFSREPPIFPTWTWFRFGNFWTLTLNFEATLKSSSVHWTLVGIQVPTGFGTIKWGKIGDYNYKKCLGMVRNPSHCLYSITGTHSLHLTKQVQVSRFVLAPPGLWTQSRSRVEPDLQFQGAPKKKKYDLTSIFFPAAQRRTN